MATYGRSLETNASPERVWRIWSDVSTWPRWNRDIETISLDGPFAAGTTGTMTTRAGGRHAITLADVQPGESFRLETSPLPLATFALLSEVQSNGSGAVISQSVSMRGPLGALFSGVGRSIADGFEPILAGLKSAAESGDSA